MAPEAGNPLKVTYTPEFKRNLRHLVKKYRHIHDDIQPIIEQLAAGTKPGEQITGVRQEVFKARARNSDAGKGKSGGYRLIYHVRSPTEIVLVTLYSKTEQGDVAAAEIRRIIAEETTGKDDVQQDDFHE